jgi:hypothetical protein
MIVDKLDVVGVVVDPAKAEPPLTIDADTELSSSISLQGFQSIAWWCAQIAQCSRGVKLLHLG